MSGTLLLSLYFGEHDSCITLANKKEILLHLEAERYFRVKHIRVTPLQMEELISVGLSYLGSSIEDVGRVLLSPWGGYDFPIDKIQLLGKTFIPTVMSHHVSHIGTILPSGFTETLIVCADGGSEDGSTKMYLKKDSQLTFLEDLSETIVTGKFYGTITQIIVDPDFYKAHVESPGKTMGLAAYGSFSSELSDRILQNKNYLCSLYPKGCPHLNNLFGVSTNFTEIWKDRRRCDLAFTAQKMWIDEFLEKISVYKNLSSNMCLVGGCALNVVLNTELAKKKWFKNVYISPVSSDCGQSLGAILSHYPQLSCQYPYLGRGFGEITNSDNLISNVLEDLLENKIVAWYQGRSEIGARALGHRSFLGLAHSREMRTRLSVEVKRREPYRPISAIVPDTYLSHMTDETIDSPYMTFAPRVHEGVKEHLPAIVHNDGSCRIQTLKKEDNEILYNILLAVGEKTAFPVLMNSSFNLAGDPIVDTPEDALETFNRSKSDVLYINGKRHLRN